MADCSTAETGSKANTRAKTRKSRFGCGECKTKRLKCDETHPSCKQCLRRGRICPGYQKQYRWSTVHEKTRQTDPVDFWPQPEHNALLQTLPQPQCCRGHAAGCENHDRGSDRDRRYEGETSADQKAMSPSATTPTLEPGDETVTSESFLIPDDQGQYDTHPGQASPSTIDVEDFMQWPLENDNACFDDPSTLYKDDASLTDIFSDLCGPSSWPVHENIVPEQHETTETALAMTGPQSPKLLYTPANLSTVLVEYWFSDVCPMWSAFDSPSNPHRQLASSAWQRSEAVFYALQSMSAACLVDSLPHVKRYVGVLSSQAVEAIQCGVEAHKQLRTEPPRSFPKELLLAIIAMGTSVCWTDTRQLGLWFLAKAHEVMEQYEDKAMYLDEYGRQELKYFREALVYWEMLYRVVGSDPRGHLKNRKEGYTRRLLHAMSVDGVSGSQDGFPMPKPHAMPQANPSKGFNLHPWTGISTDIQHTFGLVILLCRDHRLNGRKHEKRTTAALSDALCDIHMARDLARELKATDTYSGEHSTSPLTSPKGTGDLTTPMRHLVETAEAYRLAALLLLCQTFPDLQAEDLLDHSSEFPDDLEESMQSPHVSLTIAMMLVETLRRVPADSGTRCIQPVLYVCAGSGMKFTTINGESSILVKEAGRFEASARMHNTFSSKPPTASLDVALVPESDRSAVADFKTATLTKCTLEVSRGRRFVVDRLCALQRSLPPRPIGVALDLVKAIWTEYDYNSSLGNIHWLDVMVDKDFKTLFG